MHLYKAFHTAEKSFISLFILLVFNALPNSGGQFDARKQVNLVETQHPLQVGVTPSQVWSERMSGIYNYIVQDLYLPKEHVHVNQDQAMQFIVRFFLKNDDLFTDITNLFIKDTGEPELDPNCLDKLIL